MLATVSVAGCDQGQPHVTGTVSIFNASSADVRTTWTSPGVLGSPVFARAGESVVGACGEDAIGLPPGSYEIEVESAGTTTRFEFRAPDEGEGGLILAVRADGIAVVVDAAEQPPSCAQSSPPRRTLGSFG